MENQIYLITVKQPIWKQVLVHNKEDNLRHLYNWIVPFSITAPSLKCCSFRNNKYPVDTLRHCLGSRMLFTFVAANVTDLGKPWGPCQRALVSVKEQQLCGYMKTGHFPLIDESDLTQFK